MKTAAVTAAIFIVAQASAAAWWASSVDAKASELSTKVFFAEEQRKASEIRINKIENSVVRTEERIAAIQNILITISNDIRRKADR